MKILFSRTAIPLLACISLVACSGKTSDTPEMKASSQRPVSAPTALDLLNATASPNEIKRFSGTDKITFGGALASITVPASEGERKYLRDFVCMDEAECFGEKRFDRYILLKYPDIAKIRFTPSADVAGDPEAASMYKSNFVRSLFYAKQIQLADGELLFDYLTTCSGKVSSLNSAEVDENKNVIIRFFPVLRIEGSENDDEQQILLKRTGDKIEATSPMFSSSILTKPDFMKRHGYQCAKRS